MIAYLKKLIENEGKNLYLFGAGEHGKAVSKSLSLVGIRYNGIFDNAYPNGGKKEDTLILPLKILYDNPNKNDIWVVITCEHENSVRKQLMDYGINNILNMRHLAMPHIDTKEQLCFKEVSHPLVSVLITAFNGWDYTYTCLKSLYENENQCEFEVILGDDCSTDETIHAEAYIHGVNVVRHPNNMQYLRNVNTIAGLARGKYILLLANDVVLNQKRYMDRMLNRMKEDENIGILGGKIWVPMKDKYVVGRNFKDADSLVSVKEDIEQNVEEIQPVAVMIKKEAWDAVGGFDEIFLPVYWEDLDFMLRIIKEGYEIRYCPEFEVTHFHGSSYSANSLGNESYKKNREVFMNRWSEYILQGMAQRQKYWKRKWEDIKLSQVESGGNR
ncbi:MAG: glycosyltransferase [Lachnospiraceae bacterium]|nr:glycosyltransferase [Lachnospiraceae bacterium]